MPGHAQRLEVAAARVAAASAAEVFTIPAVAVDGTATRAAAMTSAKRFTPSSCL
jgi:hypothetical protein